MEHYHNQWRGEADRPFFPIGRATYPENVYVNPMENMLTNGARCASQWDLGRRPVEHSQSSVRLEGSCAQPAFSGISYDQFPPFPPAGSFYVGPETIASHGHSSFYNRHPIHEVGGSSFYPSMGVGERQCKRKWPDTSAAFERSNVAGSSSNQYWHEKRNSGYHDYTSCSSSFPQYRSDILAIGGEDFSRNVRSRSRLDLVPNNRRNDLPSNSSNHCYPMRNHTGSLTSTILNVNVAAYEQNHRIVFPSAHGMFPRSENSGVNHEMSHSVVGGGGTEIGGFSHDPTSRINHVSHPHFHGSHAQFVREGPRYHPHCVSSYRTDLSFPHFGESFPSENGSQFHSGTYPSWYARPFCAGGSHNIHRDERSRIAIERSQSHSNVADTYDRLQTEAFTRADQSSVFSPRYQFDQHHDMRLDVDNMSYEELLDLGERIGSVGTGLSQDVILECLETKFCNSGHLQEGANCAICLEDYKIKEEIGTLKNCGHDYHGSCIKKWLEIKNVCPVCKGQALADIADNL